MFAADLLTVYLGAVLVLIVTPGPDTFFVAATSAAHGPRAGVLAALGVGFGCLLHIAMATIGISALIAASPWAFGVVKIAGAAYLALLAAQALRDAWRGHAGAGVTDAPPRPALDLFLRGALTNALNPKVAMFFIAFLPQFVDPSRGPVWPQLVVLGLIFNLPGTLWLAGLAMLSGRATARLRAMPWARRALDAVVGVFFLGLAIHLARSQTRA